MHLSPMASPGTGLPSRLSRDWRPRKEEPESWRSGLAMLIRSLDGFFRRFLPPKWPVWKLPFRPAFIVIAPLPSLPSCALRWALDPPPTGGGELSRL